MNSNKVLKKTNASGISVEPVVMPRPNLTDDDLLKRCKDWITKLCDSGGKDWCLHVPVDLERDPDMLFGELIRRYREKIL